MWGNDRSVSVRKRSCSQCEETIVQSVCEETIVQSVWGNDRTVSVTMVQSVWRSCSQCARKQSCSQCVRKWSCSQCEETIVRTGQASKRRDGWRKRGEERERWEGRRWRWRSGLPHSDRQRVGLDGCCRYVWCLMWRRVCVCVCVFVCVCVCVCVCVWCVVCVCVCVWIYSWYRLLIC